MSRRAFAGRYLSEFRFFSLDLIIAFSGQNQLHDVLNCLLQPGSTIGIVVWAGYRTEAKALFWFSPAGASIDDAAKGALSLYPRAKLEHSVQSMETGRRG